MHKLRDDAARKIQGFARYIKAQEEMSARFRQVVYEANRKRIKDLKKRLWIVKIQRGYRLKLARSVGGGRAARGEGSVPLSGGGDAHTVLASTVINTVQ